MKYAIVDFGRGMAQYGTAVEEQLQRDGVHYLVYLTDAEGLLCVEFVTEDEFLDHFKKTEQNGKA